MSKSSFIIAKEQHTMKTTMFNDVKEFHLAFGHAVGELPQPISAERMSNRVKWTEEEIKELKQAVEEGSIVDIADALADIIYFCLGTAVEMGLPFDKIWQDVHSANMRKARFLPHMSDCPLAKPVRASTVECSCACGAVEYGEGGKIKKPEDWYPPEGDIAQSIVEAVEVYAKNESRRMKEENDSYMI